jgi:hypothetical protein
VTIWAAQNEPVSLGGYVSGIRHLLSLPEDKSSVHVQTLAEWMKTANAAQMYLLKDLMVAAGVTIMSGRPKKGRKSLLMYAMMLAIASGKPIGPFIPENPDGEHVIIFEQENTKAGNFKQWSWMAKGLGLDIERIPKLHFYYNFPHLVLESKETIQQVLQLIRACGAKQAVFDSLRACSSGNENDSEAASLIKNHIALIQNEDCGVMFLHHLTKATHDKNGKAVEKDIDDEIRGSGAWAGMYDQHWAIREECDDPRIPLNVTVRDKNDGDRFFKIEWLFDRRNQKTTFKMVSSFDEELLEEAENELEQVLSFGEPITEQRAKEILAMPWDATREVIERLLRNNKATWDGKLLHPSSGGSGDSEAGEAFD